MNTIKSYQVIIRPWKALAAEVAAHELVCSHTNAFHLASSTLLCLIKQMLSIYNRTKTLPVIFANLIYLPICQARVLQSSIVQNRQILSKCAAILFASQHQENRNAPNWKNVS